MFDSGDGVVRRIGIHHIPEVELTVGHSNLEICIFLDTHIQLPRF